MTKLTTIETVTDDQLRALKREGQAAGDDLQVEMCDKALSGDEYAKDLCVFVIQVNEREAQE